MNLFSRKPTAFRRRDLRAAASPKGGGSGRKFPGQGAFTLIEILVSVTVLSMMILFLFSVFNLASQAWQSSEKKVDAFREARAALFVMRRDLSGIQVGTNLPMALNQTLVDNLGTTSKPADQLFFISSLSSAMQGGNVLGDLCSVGYYVGWGVNSFQTNGTSISSKSYNLFRYFRPSDNNFSNLTVFWTGFALPGSLQPANLKKIYENASTQPQSGDEVLARNVVGFRIRPYYWQTVVATNGTNISTNTVLFSTNTGTLQDAAVFTNRPAFMDVSMAVINYATAAQLGSDSNNWNQQIINTGSNSIVNQNKQEFYMRVPLSP